MKKILILLVGLVIAFTVTVLLYVTIAVQDKRYKNY
jgi:hypothetical protein